MTIDHVTWLLFPGCQKVWWVIALHIIGRLTAPIMWFFIAEIDKSRFLGMIFMNNLRFRCLFGDNFCNLTPFEKYIEKSRLDLGVVLIAFNENEIETVCNLFKENVHAGSESRLNRIELEGSDGYIYVMYMSAIERKDKMTRSIEWSYNYFCKYRTKEIKAKKQISKFNSKYKDGILKSFGYKYNDKENNMCFPFRFRKSKNANRPLCILFHGAGAMGTDNIKQLFDNIPLYKQVLNEDCNILLPQAPFGSNNSGEAVGRYVKSVKKLIDELPFDYDRKRIYIAGTSFGGYCVWNLVYHFPGYFAAAVPVMGCLCAEDDYEKYDVQRLVGTPIWAAHSSDDNNVRIDSDDYFVRELKKLGADIKYTRWDKYGHKMSSKFYKTEKWAEWCLSKEIRN